VDYLTACTHPNERQICRGRNVVDIPSTPEALEQAFRESNLGFDLRRELEDHKVSTKDSREAFKKAVLLEKNNRAPKKGPDILGYAGQVMALARRQFQMRLQDRFQLVTSFSLSLVRRLTKRLISSNQPFRSLPLLSEPRFLTSRQHRTAHLLALASFSSAC